MLINHGVQGQADCTLARSTDWGLTLLLARPLHKHCHNAMDPVRVVLFNWLGKWKLNWRMGGVRTVAYPLPFGARPWCSFFRSVRGPSAEHLRTLSLPADHIHPLIGLPDPS